MPKKPTYEEAPELLEDDNDRRLEEIGIEKYLRQCVKIDPLRINDELIKVPGELAYWNKRYADSTERYLRAEADLKLLKGQLQPLTRNAIAKAGGKATEDMVKATIEANPDVVEAVEELVLAETAKNLLYGCLDAIRAKRDMLMSLGANMRAELQGDPQLRENHRASREYANADSEG